MTDRTKGNIALLITAIVWGTGFIGQKLGMEALPPLAFNGTRQLLAGALLLPIMVSNVKKTGYLDRTKHSVDSINFRKKKLLKAGLICGILMVLGTNLQQVGLMTVSAGKSGFISAVYIVFVPFVGLFFGRKIGLQTAGCCLLAMVGFRFLSLKGGLAGTTPGDWLTLASALSFALQITAVNCFVDKDNDIIISTLQMIFTGIFTLVISFFFEQASMEGFVQSIPVILYTAFIPTAIGYTLQIVGQKYAEPTTAAFLMSLEAVFAVLFGAIMLGESMSLKETIGAGLIFVSNILIQYEPKSSKKNKARSLDKR